MGYPTRAVQRLVQDVATLELTESKERPVAYPNKTYIAFDGDNDMHFYRLITAWLAIGR